MAEYIHAVSSFSEWRKFTRDTMIMHEKSLNCTQSSLAGSKVHLLERLTKKLIKLYQN